MPNSARRSSRPNLSWRWLNSSTTHAPLQASRKPSWPTSSAPTSRSSPDWKTPITRGTLFPCSAVSHRPLVNALTFAFCPCTPLARPDYAARRFGSKALTTRTFFLGSTVFDKGSKPAAFLARLTSSQISRSCRCTGTQASSGVLLNSSKSLSLDKLVARSTKVVSIAVGRRWKLLPALLIVHHRGIAQVELVKVDMQAAAAAGL